MRSGARAAPWLLCLALAAAAAPGPAAAQAGRDAAARTAASTLRTAQAGRDPILGSAERAAREWLWLLDEQRYADAWALVAPAMQSAITYERWATSLERLRAVLPNVLRRELLRAEPGGPLFGGESVMLSFGVGPLREIVVLVRREPTWQVGGYGILRD